MNVSKNMDLGLNFFDSFSKRLAALELILGNVAHSPGWGMGDQYISGGLEWLPMFLKFFIFFLEGASRKSSPFGPRTPPYFNPFDFQSTIIKIV